jgi:hypothetical protein
VAERTYSTPLIDKLGVKPGARIALVGLAEADIEAPLRDRTDDIVEGQPKPGSDLIFLAADSPADLAHLASLRAALQPAGGIWIVSRKGRQATIRDVEVIAASIAAGLVDNKVVAFSATHTALRAVIPRALRPGVPSARG